MLAVSDGDCDWMIGFWHGGLILVQVHVLAIKRAYAGLTHAGNAGVAEEAD